MFHVYVLWSEKLRKRYIGSTANLTKRVRAHNARGPRLTKSGVPWILILTEEFQTLSEARQRERFLKRGFGRAWLDTQFPDLR